MKRCRQCRILKAVGSFPFRKDKQRFTARCKTCVHKRQAAWLRAKRAGQDSDLPPDATVAVLEQKDALLARMYAHTVINHESGCREWLTAKRRDGYPLVFVKIRDQWYQIGGHRIIAAIFHGLNLADGDSLACHRCDNGCCCEQAHIFVGTHADNQQDAQRKGRLVGNRRISDDVVRAIRMRRSAGAKIEDIAQAVGVHRLTVGLIVRKKLYGAVE